MYGADPSLVLARMVAWVRRVSEEGSAAAEEVNVSFKKRLEQDASSVRSSSKHYAKEKQIGRITRPFRRSIVPLHSRDENRWAREEKKRRTELIDGIASDAQTVSPSSPLRCSSVVERKLPDEEVERKVTSATCGPLSCVSTMSKREARPRANIYIYLFGTAPAPQWPTHHRASTSGRDGFHTSDSRSQIFRLLYPTHL